MQNKLGILGVVGLAALLAGCGSNPDPAPVAAAFTFNDCALISAIGKERYNFTRDDPPTRVMLNGEDARWTPNCDWQAMGFNLLEPEAAGADRMGEVTFTRPQYDDKGADMRTSLTALGGTTESVLCRLKRSGGAWKVETCGADPRLTQPRAAAPSPADTTPDAGAGAPPPGEAAPQRPVTIPDPEPK